MIPRFSDGCGQGGKAVLQYLSYRQRLQSITSDVQFPPGPDLADSPKQQFMQESIQDKKIQENTRKYKKIQENVLNLIYALASRTLPPPILKLDFDIEVQNFDIKVTYVDIEATKKLRYQSFFDIQGCNFDIGTQCRSASISKCMYFDIDFSILRYRSTRYQI